jgi:beta-glucosidase
MKDTNRAKPDANGLYRILIGTATSAHQVEGDNGNSDWWYFERAGRIKHSSGSACGQYELYRKDIELMKSLKLNAYRFSIELSRVMPKPGVIDRDALEHYTKLTDALNENGIEPIPTLWHYTLPLWMQKEGGMANKKNVRYFKEYASALFEKGLNARYLLTANEPLLYAGSAYLFGIYPPFKRLSADFFRVLDNTTDMHNEIYDIAKSYGYEVSLTNNFMNVDRNPILFPVNKMIDYFLNKRALENAKLDFISVNYYTDVRLRNMTQFITSRGKRRDTENDEHSLERILLEMHNRFNKPVFVTENGINTTDENVRRKFIVENFNEVLSAMSRGVSVIGYLYWSLIDNYEWDFGYEPKYGIFGLDRITKERIMKPSALTLRYIAENYGLQTK